MALFADDDPRFLLPEEDRLFANIQGVVPKYSSTLKQHVAETLAFLGAFGSELEAASSGVMKAFVDRLIASALPQRLVREVS